MKEKLRLRLVYHEIIFHYIVLIDRNDRLISHYALATPYAVMKLIGLGNDLLPDGTQPLSDVMLYLHQCVQYNSLEYNFPGNIPYIKL